MIAFAKQFCVAATTPVSDAAEDCKSQSLPNEGTPNRLVDAIDVATTAKERLSAGFAVPVAEPAPTEMAEDPAPATVAPAETETVSPPTEESPGVGVAGPEAEKSAAREQPKEVVFNSKIELEPEAAQPTEAPALDEQQRRLNAFREIHKSCLEDARVEFGQFRMSEDFYKAAAMLDFVDRGAAYITIDKGMARWIVTCKRVNMYIALQEMLCRLPGNTTSMFALGRRLRAVYPGLCDDWLYERRDLLKQLVEPQALPGSAKYAWFNKHKDDGTLQFALNWVMEANEIQNFVGILGARLAVELGLTQQDELDAFETALIYLAGSHVQTLYANIFFGPLCDMSAGRESLVRSQASLKQYEAAVARLKLRHLGRSWRL